MSYLEELLPEFRKGAKIRRKSWIIGLEGVCKSDDYTFDAYDIDASDWEIVPDEPIDWNSIIENKCLCWFFDGNEEVIGSAGILTEVKSREEYPFIKTFNGIKFAYQHCRPVRKNEINFYKDRNDE